MYLCIGASKFCFVRVTSLSHYWKSRKIETGIFHCLMNLYQVDSMHKQFSITKNIKTLEHVLSHSKKIALEFIRSFYLSFYVSVCLSVCTFLVFSSVQYHFLRLYFYLFRIATKIVIQRAHCKSLFYHLTLPQMSVCLSDRLTNQLTECSIDLHRMGLTDWLKSMLTL